MEHQMDLLIDKSTWVPVLFRSSPVRSIRSRNYTQQQSPVSHRVTVKYRNHTQIPKCPFQNFLNRLNQLDFKGGGLIRGGVADVDA